MSLKAADEGLKKKLENIYPNVIFAPSERAFEVSADSHNEAIISDGTTSEVADYILEQDGHVQDEAIQGVPYTYKGKSPNRTSSGVVKFPLIAFDRLSNPYSEGYDIVDQMHRTGPYWSDEQSREKSFSADLNYQIDIISDRRVDVDEIWREVTIVLLKNNSVAVEYNTEGQVLVEEYPLKVVDTEFGRDVLSFFDKGVVYRQSIIVQMTNVRMLFVEKSKLIEEVPVRVIPIIIEQEVHDE